MVGRALHLGETLAAKAGWLPATLARLTLGIEFLLTGWGKVHNLDQVTEFFTSLGIPMPSFNAHLVAFTELSCGALLLVGLLTRLAAVPLIVTMTVAIISAKRADLESWTDLVTLIEFTYIVILVWIAVAGPGPLSIDRVLRRAFGRAEPPPRRVS